MKLLMTEQMVEHHGAFYDFDLLNMAPGTTKPIEIVIGGLSDAALARAAKHDGWIGGEHSMEELVDFVSSFKQQRDRQGIPSAKPFNLYSCVKDYDDNKCKIAEQLGVTVYRNTWLQDGKAGAIPLKTKMNDMETFAKRYIL
jgi:hypothetical protein